MSILRDIVKSLLHEDETILFHTQCSLSLFLGKLPTAPGVVLTTNKRLLFIYKEKTESNPPRFEEYLYERIEEVKEHPYFFNSHIALYYNDEWVQFRDIYDKNVRKQFCSIIQKQITSSSIS
ncbi:PH domain-containing protein [Bacillus cereus group sp. BfR-BA-01380]|uniref:PH domain-containing protein n=1 Tax=Bacillus cereus group sp. BfR-BA-01380 TaxID=2920324 RepID=UPI001F5A44E4|nr:PH domain-containing protein [Bacillus cereus group sp. BfR-BA-01380]